MNPSFLTLLLSAFLILNLSADEKANVKQAGVGTVDRYMAHGKEVYRFVPTDEKLRMVKFVPGQLGYKKNQLPEEYETILAAALADKKEIYFECEYFDHGPGKTAIGKKIIELKFAEAK